MTVEAPSGITDRLCAVVANAGGTDPIGTAGTVIRFFAIEIPTPWGDGLYAADPHGPWLGRVNVLRTAYLARTRVGHDLPPEGYASMYGLAPDPDWTVPGYTRVLIGLKPADAFDGYSMSEYLLPTDDDIVEAARVFFDAPEELHTLDRFRSTAPPRREFFVCTHGNVDICCARFGIDLYRQARAAYPLVRAWRTTHFGGHRFAPTAWEFPSGYKWAYLDDEHAGHVIHRDVSAGSLRDILRGVSALPPVLQVVDREGLALHGWDWLQYARSGAITHADEEAQRWEARLVFAGPGGIRGTYVATIGVRQQVPLFGCGNAASDSIGTLPEYQLESFRLVTEAKPETGH